MSKFQELLIKTGAIFCAFLGGYSLYTVFSKGRYHSVSDNLILLGFRNNCGCLFLGI